MRSSPATASGPPTSSRIRSRAIRRSIDVLRTLLAGGDCEIGAHHHAWETPPCSPEDVVRHPYALSLPLDQFDAQLASLTLAIEEAVGRRPVSYRSGRFGFSAAHVSSLERQGYLVESSVTPLFYEAHKHGPDFVGAPLAPYYLSYDSATRPGTSQLLELPISAALNRRVPGVPRALVRPRAVAVHDEAAAAPDEDRRSALAAAVLQLGGADDRARAPARRARRADPESALPLERSHRRAAAPTTARRASSMRSSIAWARSSRSPPGRSAPSR